jgi:hypothetical protein
VVVSVKSGLVDGVGAMLDGLFRAALRALLNGSGQT